MYTPDTTILIEENFWEIPQFSKKLPLCAKFGQKWFSWDFEVLRLSYVTISQNFSPMPAVCIPNIIIPTKKNLWEISQFSRKTYTVCKI